MSTLGQKLAAYRAKRVHVTDIPEPLVRAMWWRAWEHTNAQIMDECRRFPSEYDVLFAAAEREVEVARAARRRILTHLWALRPWASQNTVTERNAA